MARPVTQGADALQTDADRISRALKRARRNKTRARPINRELVRILKRAVVIINSDEEEDETDKEEVSQRTPVRAKLKRTGSSG